VVIIYFEWRWQCCNILASYCHLKAHPLHNSALEVEDLTTMSEFLLSNSEHVEQAMINVLHIAGHIMQMKLAMPFCVPCS